MGEKRGSVGANEKDLDQACHWSQQNEMTAQCMEVISTRELQQQCNHKATEWRAGTRIGSLSVTHKTNDCDIEVLFVENRD